MSSKLLPLLCLLSVFHACSTKVEEDEYEDGTANQKWILAPKTQDTDVTLILNKLLREYDKKLRPDIGIKPTVIDVDIYVNSIGPVSSINMSLDDLDDPLIDLFQYLSVLYWESPNLHNTLEESTQGLNRGEQSCPTHWRCSR
ncbi:gamma-aminobutyric acid receptor subunit gamma-3-like protein [Turdus rufiventris]|nr:gamma-aminobutyric acid receptor subunit gamma-3-like protein [Turdus rufiventris]